MNLKITDIEVGGWLVWAKHLNDDFKYECCYKVVKVLANIIAVKWDDKEYYYRLDELTDGVKYVGPNEDLEKKILYWKLKYNE